MRPLDSWITKFLNEGIDLDEVNEKKTPKKGSPEYHQHKIACDTVKNPSKSLMGGPSEKEAIEMLKTKFGYSDSDIKKLKK